MITIDSYYEMYIFIHIILGAYLLGNYIGDVKPTYIQLIAGTIFCLLIGLEYVIIQNVFTLIKRFLRWIDGLLQIRFYYTFYCTKKLNEIDENHKEFCKHTYQKLINKKNKTIKEKSMLRCVLLMKKRFNLDLEEELKYKHY